MLKKYAMSLLCCKKQEEIVYQFRGNKIYAVNKKGQCLNVIQNEYVIY